MRFELNINKSPTLKSFLDIQNEMNRVFWKKRGQHNYKQIVCYRNGSSYYPITNEKDIESIFTTKTIYIKFIHKQHFTTIYEAAGNYDGAPIHMDISCDGCGIQPIIGTVYKCLECLNIHLCEICEADKQHSQHMMFSAKNSEIKAKLHAAIHCDRCGVEPIIGFHYKCVSCNLSYCEYCNVEQSQCVDHGKIRCPNTGGETETGTVDTQVDVQIVEDRQLKIINNKLDKVLEVITSDGLNIAGATVLGRCTASEISHNQEEKSDESTEVDRTVYKAD